MTSSRSRLSRFPFFPLSRFVRSFENPRYLVKWVLFSAVIGVIAGVGAIAFFAAIHYATVFLLGGIVGYLPPSPGGEGATTIMPFWSSIRPWLLPVVTTAGGLVAGIIVFSIAPEAEGHGTDAAIAAFHTGKAVRARIPIVKLVASAITIGSGGSAGREGPVAQISAGFGSILAGLLHMDVQDRRIAVATGIGAGIGSIFRAPLGGAILAAEILYKDDLEVEALIPGLIASIVGYTIFSSWGGWSPIFILPKDLAFSSPPQLLYYLLIGLLCGGIGWLYAHGFYGITHIFHRLHLPNWIKPGIGGLLVGLIGLVIPQALGMGYGWVQVSMGQGLLSIPLWVILLLPFAKILTTGLSIGSGGSGGIFGPGMVIGGTTGAIVWRLTYHVLPGVPPTPGPFVVVGMMALFGGVAHAPLAVMLMVAEMTGNLSLLAPAMIAVSLSYLIIGQTTIYANQPPTRADSPAHRLQFSFPLLSTLFVQQAMAPVRVQLRETQTVAEAAALLAAQQLAGAPVLSEQGMLLGVLTHTDVERVSEAERAKKRVGAAMNRDVLVIHTSESLDEALEELTTDRVSWAPVVEAQALTPNRRVLGVISVTDIVRLYRKTISKDTHRMRGLVEGTVMQEVVVTPDMPFVGRPLREAAFPAGCLVVSIRRGSELLFPNGGTVIKAGDTITVLMSPLGEIRWQEYLNAARAVQDGAAQPTSSVLSAREP